MKDIFDISQIQVYAFPVEQNSLVLLKEKFLFLDSTFFGIALPLLLSANIRINYFAISNRVTWMKPHAAYVIQTKPKILEKQKLQIS